MDSGQNPVEPLLRIYWVGQETIYGHIAGGKGGEFIRFQ